MKALYALAHLASLVSGDLNPLKTRDLTKSEWIEYCRSRAEVYERRSPNSTGSLYFDSPLAASEDHASRAEEPWHLTLSLNDFRPYDLDELPNMDSQQLKFFLSVPEAQTDVQGLSICYYTFQSLNATSTGRQGEESCEGGVIPEACLDVLGSSLPSGTCVLSEAKQQEAAEKCGMLGTNWDAADFSYRSCTAEDVPYVLVPPGYRTSIESPDVIFMDHHETASDFTSYDLRVRQAVPIVLVTSWNRTRSSTPGAAQGHTQILCLAPSNVTEGSREPEQGTTPEESSKPEASSQPEGNREQNASNDPKTGSNSTVDDSQAVATGASLILASVGAVMAWTLFYA